MEAARGEKRLGKYREKEILYILSGIYDGIGLNSPTVMFA
jgi:hypothetical protein